MPKVQFDKFGIVVEKNGFGALPIQRLDMTDAVRILRNAYDGGIQLFDTARNYTNSEEKIGAALHDVRDKIIIASKTHALDVPTFWKELEISLRNLKTDYIDIHQFHNPPTLFRPDDGTGMYEAMLEARKQGKIRHIALSSHRLQVAREGVRSGLYMSLEFPFSYLATKEEEDLVRETHAAGMIFLCMKGLAGGLLKNFYAANAYIAQFPGAIPIWGIQRDEELVELLDCVRNVPQITNEYRALMENDRKELQSEFCRGCAYCLPCPAGIEIYTAARMSLMLHRSPATFYASEKSRAMMAKIDDCVGCNQCKSRCPYQLDPPALLKKNLEAFRQFTAGLK